METHIDGSIIHMSTIEAAQEFLSTLPTFDITELQKHELYPLLHDTHIRIIHWLMPELPEYQDERQSSTLPGGSGQILHGLAFGKEEDDNPFRIMTKREVTKLDFDSSISALVYSGPKDFIEADAVILAASEKELTVTLYLFRIALNLFHLRYCLLPLQDIPLVKKYLTRLL
jgi:hypothetical protein